MTGRTNDPTFDDFLVGDVVVWQDPSGKRRRGIIHSINKTRVTMTLDSMWYFEVSRKKFDARNPNVVRRSVRPDTHPAAAFAAAEANTPDETATRRQARTRKPKTA